MGVTVYHDRWLTYAFHAAKHSPHVQRGLHCCSDPQTVWGRGLVVEVQGQCNKVRETSARLFQLIYLSE